MTEKKDFSLYNTWQGHNENIPSSFLEIKKFTHQLYEIGNNSVYAPSMTQLEEIYVSCFHNENKDCFQSLFIYVHENKIAGYLNVRILFSEAEIHFICTNPQFKRQHIAFKLMNYFMEKKFPSLYTPLIPTQLKNHVNFEEREFTEIKIFLEVGVNNQIALQFYEKLGFKKISLRKKYYKHGEDAWSMVYHY